MAKMIAFMLMLYLGMALCVGILAGGGGYSVTDLTSDITSDAVVIDVTSTEGFTAPDYVEIGDETVLCTGTTATSFTGCTRGCNGTTATTHSDGDSCYTTSASTINDVLGFNVAATVDSMGVWSIITVPFNFFFKTIPRLLLMPYKLFTGDLVIFAVILVIIQVAIVIAIAMSFIGARRV